MVCPHAALRCTTRNIPVARIKVQEAEAKEKDKAKAKEDFARLSDLVHGLDARLYSEHSLAERMSALLCATWSDKAALLSLCNVYGMKLLAACLDAVIRSDETMLIEKLLRSFRLPNAPPLPSPSASSAASPPPLLASAACCCCICISYSCLC